jgi:hypothetical protein
LAGVIARARRGTHLAIDQRRGDFVMPQQRRKGRLSEQLYHTFEQLGHDLEDTADDVRRRLARNLREIAPTVQYSGQNIAGALARGAARIDRALTREGKRTSQPPPPPRNTRPGYY